MDGSAKQSEFERLLARLTERALKPAEREQLGRLIQADSALRRHYLEHCQMHAMLQSEHGLLVAWSSRPGEFETVPTIRGLRATIIRYGAMVGIAASLLVAAGYWYLERRSPYPAQPRR